VNVGHVCHRLHAAAASNVDLRQMQSRESSRRLDLNSQSGGRSAGSTAAVTGHAMIYRSRLLAQRLREACGWVESCLGSTAANPAPSVEQCRPRSTHQVNIWCDAAIQKEAIVAR
jgi:hypothetical protein